MCFSENERASEEFLLWLGSTEFACIRGRVGDMRAIPGAVEGTDQGEVQSLFTGDFDGCIMDLELQFPETPLPDEATGLMTFAWQLGEDEVPESMKEPLEEIAKALPDLEIALGVWEEFEEGVQAHYCFSPKGSGVLMETNRAELFAQAAASGWDLESIWQDPDFDEAWGEEDE